MAEFRMPQLGADMSAGKLLRWRKQPGDPVQRGDIIADVETDKADIEVEVFVTGVIEKFLVQPGEKLPVGTVLAFIREEGKPAAAEAPPVLPVAPAPAAVAPEIFPAAAAPAARAIPAAAGVERRLHISPVARKAAADLGIDPATVQGSGPAGRITLEDIQRAAQARGAQPPPEAAPDRQTRLRQVIAAAMARSKREIPHYYLSTTMDVSRALAWLAQGNLQRSVEDRLVYGVLLLKAAALALREVPELNGFWREGRAAPSADVHIGVAISLRGGGLVAPALHHTDRQSLGELMKNFRDLVQRARAGSLRSSELSDPTFTVTSLGEQGVECVFGIIYPPQVAIAGFGKIVERPWSAEGQIVSRPLLTATLSGDHRVSDGHRGGLFLAAVDRLLQEPEKL
ncbi:MAG: 2-oxo acid dehydrogenase subunit E2 [Acidobacteriia bacterium]|nr:2-oxo acid dehydrogenase subunit E2 [Terriglobia bacterium]